MAVYQVLVAIGRQQNFQDRVKYAMQKAALDVMAEAGNVVGHLLRVTYAGKVLAGTASVFEATVAVLNNSTIAAEADMAQSSVAGFAIPDSDIQFAMNSIFNALAGVAN